MIYQNIGDSELIYLIRCNNLIAKEYLVERYKKRIYGFIKSIKDKFGLKELSYQDYCGECLLVFFKCLELYDEEYNFFNYVKGAIDNRLKRLVINDIKDLEIMSLDAFCEDEFSMLDVIGENSQEYEKAEIEDFIDHHFNDMDIKIINYRLEGYSCLEIANLLSISLKKVYKRLEKIKIILSSEL